jgi:tetratricopeptide (TPR) repeat protein
MRLSWVHSCGAVFALGLLFGSAPAQGQTLPDFRLDTYPPVSREPISAAWLDVRDHPGDPARLGRLGMVLEAWEQWAAAADAYALARTLERRFEWYYLGGVVAARSAHHAEAATLFREAVALSPSSTAARLKLADALLESGALDDAQREYGSALADPLAGPHAQYGLGRILAIRGQHAAATAHFDEAVRLYPEFGAAWYARGLAQRNMNRIEEARESLSRAQQYGARWPSVDDPFLARVNTLRTDPKARIERGVQLERQGDVRGAIREHEAALAEDPRFTQAHVNLIRLYGREKDWSKGEAHYREAVRLGAPGPDAYYNYGVTLLLQERDGDAAATLQRVVDANPQHAGAWNSLGQIAERGGRFDEALARYRTAVDSAPADSGMRFNLGRLLIAMRRYREAIAQFEILANEVGPEQPRYVFGLATAWVLSGDLAKGRTIALQARALAVARGQTDLVAAIDRDLALLPGGGAP